MVYGKAVFCLRIYLMYIIALSACRTGCCAGNPLINHLIWKTYILYNYTLNGEIVHEHDTVKLDT